MKKTSRLIQLLYSLSNEERKRLHRFVQSPYFNTDKYVTKLLDVFDKDIIGKRTLDEVASCKVYNKVFDKPSKSQKQLDEKEKKFFRAKMSILTQLTKHFISIEALKSHKTYSNDLLLSELLKRRQFDLFESVIKKERKILEAEQEKGIKYFEFKYMLEQKILDYLSLDIRTLMKNDNIDETNRSLDIKYLLNKLHLHLGTISLVRSLDKTYDFSSIEAITQLLDLPQYKKHPIVQIYRIGIKMVNSSKEGDYKELVELLRNVQFENKFYFYAIASNFCTYRIMSGELSYQRHLFDLYKMMENNNALKQNNRISIDLLKNIIRVSSYVKEFEWGRFIIEKYRPHILEEVRDSVCYFNLGHIAFYEKKYKEAIQNLIRVERINLSYDINCRILIMKSHYETDEEYDERTVQIFRSAGKFIGDNKQIAAKRKKADKNFINSLINLYRIKHGVGKKVLKDIRQIIESFDLINYKLWLIEKIKEIEK